jgi:hypothetical protein
MSYSAQNSLKVFISGYSSPTSGTTTTTLAALPVGEIGFYSEAGLLLPTGIGTGFFAWRKTLDTQVLRSKVFTFAGWAAAKKAYAAPTLESQAITITAANSTLYQIWLEMKIPGLGGNYIKHAQYKSAASGDTATTIGDALVASLKANLAREGKDGYFTITNATGTITIQNKLLPYVRGKKKGHPIWFKASLTYPTTQAAVFTQTVAPSDGVGYGPYICEQEFFAQGDSDEMRFLGYPNSFDDKALVGSSTGRYDVTPATITDVVQTANADVRANQQYLICFDSIGVTPTPIMTNASLAAGTVTVTGWATPGSTVYLWDNGVITGSTVAANGTTGAVSISGCTIVAGHTYYIKATESGAVVSGASNSLVATS